MAVATSPITSVTSLTNEEKFNMLAADFEKNPAALQAFLENPRPVLEAAGIPMVREWSIPPELQQTPAELQVAIEKAKPLIDEAAKMLTARPRLAAAPGAANLRVRLHWWGVDFIMNEKLTEDVIEGIGMSGPFAAVVVAALGYAGVLTGGLADAVAAILAVTIELKRWQVKLVNKGKGVHWPVTWAQWVVLVPGGVGGAMLWLHPVRN